MTTETQKWIKRTDDTVAPDYPVADKTADYTLVAGDIGKEFAFNKATAVTANLPAAATAGNGYNAILRNVGNGDLTVDPNGAETIDGSSSLTVKKDGWCWIICTGSLWRCVVKCVDGCDGGGGSSSTTIYRTTETSNVDLGTCASGGTQVGSTLSSVDIPSAGTIRVTVLEAELEETGGSSTASFGVGLDVDGTAVIAQSEDGGGNGIYAPFLSVGASTSAALSGGFSASTGTTVAMVSYDVGTHFSGSAGSQKDVKILMGDQGVSHYSGAGRLAGATKTAVFLVEVIPTT